MEVILEGQQHLFAALDEFRDEAMEEASKGLQRAGMGIVEAAQNNLLMHHSNTTGHLSQSGSTRKLPDGSIEAGFMQVPEGAQANYAEYLEMGTRPHWVSLKWLVPYMQKKHSRVFASATAFGGEKGMAWAMAKAAQKTIAEKGTKAHPFFRPAVKAYEKDVVDAIRDAINKAIRKTTI